MTTRDTSIQILREIEENGLLSTLRLQVYRAVVTVGPMTAQECWHYLRDQRAREGDARINGITPRFSELERLGVIHEVEKRPCTITGNICVVWGTTNQRPLPTSALRGRSRAAKKANLLRYVDTGLERMGAVRPTQTQVMRFIGRIRAGVNGL